MKNPCLWRCWNCNYAVVRHPTLTDMEVEFTCPRCHTHRTRFVRDAETFFLTNDEMLEIGSYFEIPKGVDERCVHDCQSVREWFKWIVTVGHIHVARYNEFREIEFTGLPTK